MKAYIWLSLVACLQDSWLSPLYSSDLNQYLSTQEPRLELVTRGCSKDFIECHDPSLEQLASKPDDRDANFTIGSKILNYADTLFVQHLLGSSSFNYLKKANVESYLKLLLNADEYLDIAASQGHPEARQALQLQNTLSLSIESSKGWYITDNLLTFYKGGEQERPEKINDLKNRIAAIVKKYAARK